jgi:bacillithiol synthase
VTDSIADAYRAGAAREFFGAHFADPAERRGAVRCAARPLAAAVGAALEAQNARLVPSSARDAHLAALRDGAAAVVTGQQVGLFLGPLYTIYKAASAVRVAQALAAESGRPVAPIFWLQTEDHDLPEVAECRVPRVGAEPLVLRLPEPAGEARVSMVHRRLPGEVSTCLGQLGDEVGSRPRAANHLARLARHYRPGASWVAAFAGVLAELFAEEGLVLLDPRDPALAAAAVPVHEHALDAAGPIAAALEARCETLAAAGFAAPVHVRAGAPLSFFHPHGADGPRHRLAAAPDAFAEVGGDGVHTLASLRATLADEPLRFSTSALLRPILQDFLLPTAAYVAGPGEVAYFAQLAPLYDAYALRMPVVVPRASFRLLDDAAQRTLARLGLGAADAERSEDDLLAQVRIAAPLGGTGDLAQALLGPFERALDEVRAALHDAGPGMTAAADKTRATVAGAVGRLAAKYERAWLHRDEEVREQVRRLKRSLHPNGVPQERCYGLAYFAACAGDRELIAQVLTAIEPFDPTTRDISVAS